jgi:hypothetical protein
MEAESLMKKIVKIVCAGVILFFAPLILFYVVEYYKKDTIYIRTS